MFSTPTASGELTNITQSETANPLQTYERPDTSDSEVGSMDVPQNLIGKYGDPKLWAQSTLNNAHVEDLVEVYAVTQSMFVSNESIRNRMWLHDLLDDKKIPYYIEVGGMSGSRQLVEAQCIYVEKKNAEKALLLIKQFNNPDSIVLEDSEEEDLPEFSEDGIPQKKCPSCDESIDFDYPVCPHCKERVD